MTLPHFFLNEQVIADELEGIFALRLGVEDTKHAKVLRLKQGEHIAVIDATQDYFECAIESFDGHDLFVHSASKIDQEEDRAHVVLIQGLAKGEKMDAIIRQGTEIGVSAFIPFTSQRSVVKLNEAKAATRQRRWQSIARSAAMQSAQVHIPEISELMTIDQVCDFISQAAVVLVCWEEEKEAGMGQRLHAALATQGIAPQDARVAVVVGPEGGLAEEEVQALLAANRFSFSVSLGSSILRTETAGVIAPALILHELGVLA